jgi:hypothetical protein
MSADVCLYLTCRSLTKVDKELAHGLEGVILIFEETP